MLCQRCFAAHGTGQRIAGAVKAAIMTHSTADAAHQYKQQLEQRCYAECTATLDV